MNEEGYAVIGRESITIGRLVNNRQGVKEQFMVYSGVDKKSVGRLEIETSFKAKVKEEPAEKKE